MTKDELNQLAQKTAMDIVASHHEQMAQDLTNMLHEVSTNGKVSSMDIRNVIVPIIVSALTCWITLWIQGAYSCP